MIEQVRHLLQEHQLTRAVIIDDAYDDHPRAGDIESEQWDRFWNDLTDADQTAVAGAYGIDKYAQQSPSDLNREQSFVDSLWRQRAGVLALRDCCSRSLKLFRIESVLSFNRSRRFSRTS